MTKNHSPSSINEGQQLHPGKIIYGSDQVESYFLTAAEVKNILDNGKTPLVYPLAEAAKGRPVIALIMAQDKHPDRVEPDYSMYPDYVEAVVKVGGYPVFTVYDRMREQLELLQPQGIILIGGDFAFPPEWFENPPAVPVSKRALAYLEMIKYAEEHQLPTLGICGGEQIMAGYCGGGLIREINKGAAETQSHRRGGYIIAHDIIVEENSLLFDILGKKRLAVNTAHHEAVDPKRPGECRITAYAEDGIIEAIEPKTPWNPFVLGVQWHPERLVKLGDREQLKIFERFTEECRRVKPAAERD